MSWIQELHNLEDFKVNRCFKPTNFGTVTSAQLHHFADACQDGYGTVSYLLLHDNHGQTHCAFVMGKARVAPLKPVTIPRMELTAATMAGRMDTILRKELQMELADSTFWTDGTSVLKYIKNRTTRFRTFVANRVTEIAKASDEHQWSYVNTNDNPADMASRGVKVKAFLKKEMWVYGPPFLLGPQEEWPQNPDGLDAISPKDSEVKSITVNAAQITLEVVDPTTNFIHYFSSWNQLKRAVAWMLRIKGLLLQGIRKRKTASGVLSLQGNLDTQEIHLTISELENAEIEIIRFCQKKRF